MREPHDRLRWAREQKFESAAEAARAIGVPYQTYIAHENGNRGFPREAAKYARRFGVSPIWLLTGEGVAKPGQKPEALDLYERIPPDRRDMALRMLRSLLDE